MQAVQLHPKIKNGNLALSGTPATLTVLEAYTDTCSLFPAAATKSYQLRLAFLQFKGDEALLETPSLKED